jgi:hypothetical protein
MSYVHNMNSYRFITHSVADACIRTRLKMTQEKGQNM